MIDEGQIRQEVYDKTVSLVVNVDWYTPSGNRRKEPVYTAEIANAFLDISKQVKAKTVDELQQKARKQLEAWAEREIRARVANAKERLSSALEAKVEELNSEVATLAKGLDGLLASTLEVDDFVDINGLKRPEQPLREKIAALERPLPDYPEPVQAEMVKGWFRRRKR